MSKRVKEKVDYDQDMVVHENIIKNIPCIVRDEVVDEIEKKVIDLCEFVGREIKIILDI